MSFEELASDWLVGDADGITWHDMFVWFMVYDYAHFMTVLADVYVNGIQDPVILGDDGRVWDGHHRIVVAGKLGIPIPYHLPPDL
jgi:hypothetical protein